MEGTDMRGMSGVYKRGPSWWIRYSLRGRKVRESTRSTEGRDAVRLLKQRMAELHQGKPSGPDEQRVMFDQIAADYIDERTLKTSPNRDRNGPRPGLPI